MEDLTMTETARDRAPEPRHTTCHFCGSRHFLRPDHTARAVALQELKAVVWAFSKDPLPSLVEHLTRSELSLKVPWG
eukprot:scaffold6865_cov62-Phaeocystis_antarctica.AAC.1